MGSPLGSNGLLLKRSSYTSQSPAFPGQRMCVIWQHPRQVSAFVSPQILLSSHPANKRSLSPNTSNVLTQTFDSALYSRQLGPLTTTLTPPLKIPSPTRPLSSSHDLSAPPQHPRQRSVPRPLCGLPLRVPLLPRLGLRFSCHRGQGRGGLPGHSAQHPGCRHRRLRLCHIWRAGSLAFRGDDTGRPAPAQL